MSFSRARRAPGVCALIGVLSVAVSSAEAGSPVFRRSRRVTTQYVARTAMPAGATGLAPSPMLGTFYPTPYIIVRGDGPAGGGYTPHGQSGDFAMSVYGPLSALRQVAA